LINFIKNSYLQFIKANISNLIKEKKKENLSNFFSNLKITFPGYPSKNFATVYNMISDIGKNIFNEKLNIFRTTLCLGCFKFIDINNKVFLFKLPCGCSFCSEECLKRFINAVPLKKMNSFICACGENYDYIQLKFLLYFAISHNLINLKNEILKYMFEIMKNKCCICNLEIPLLQEKKNNLNIMEITDKETEKIFGISKFNHLICDKCEKTQKINNNNNNYFYCNLCSNVHFLINKKNIKDCRIRSNCSIF
jgi:hypothetical protein